MKTLNPIDSKNIVLIRFKNINLLQIFISFLQPRMQRIIKTVVGFPASCPLLHLKLNPTINLIIPKCGPRGGTNQEFIWQSATR
jgi:hypothetical protein